MVKFALGNDGKYLNAEYHRRRYEARTESFSIDEFGPIDIERYDLDTVDFDRKQKDSSYITEIVGPQASGASQPGKDWSDDPIDGE